MKTMALIACLFLVGCAHQISQNSATEMSSADQPLLPYGIDDGGLRDHWPTLTFGFPTGTTTHPVAYYDGVPVTESDAADAPTTEIALKQAMANVQPGLVSPYHVGDSFVQPASFMIDSILLPIRVILTPPWVLEETPGDRRYQDL